MILASSPIRPGDRSRPDHRRGRGGPHGHAQHHRTARPGLPGGRLPGRRSGQEQPGHRPNQSLGRHRKPAPNDPGTAIDQVIITLPWQYHRKTVRLVADAEHAGVRARVVPDLFQLSLGGVDVEAINGIPLISIKQSALTGFNLVVKRAFDLTLGGPMILTVAVLACIAAGIKLDSPGPVFFRQERVGKNGKPFTVYKFRSMYEDAESGSKNCRAHNEADGPIFKMKDDPRRTRVGRFIRKTSLDELPQLINVLRGEMSIVGPRPGLPSEVAQYQEWHRKRLEAQPGITGLWQVSGRSNLTFDEMVMLDIYYAENWSVGMDLRIMLRTVPQVLFGEGAY